MGSLRTAAFAGQRPADPAGPSLSGRLRLDTPRFAWLAPDHPEAPGVKAGHYGNTSEYLRELIRRDQEDQAKKRLRKLIEDGLNSGPGRAVTTEFAKGLKDRALGGLRGSPRGSVQMPRTT